MSGRREKEFRTTARVEQDRGTTGRQILDGSQE